MARSPLDAIAGTVARAFKGKLHRGTLWRYTPSTTLNARGDPTGGSWASYPSEGIVEEYSDIYRAQAGIPEGVVKVLILAGSLSVQPRKDDVMALRGGWYRSRGPVKTDPAKATWEVQATETGPVTPTNAPPENALMLGDELLTLGDEILTLGD